MKGVGANNAYKVITSSSSYKKCIMNICENFNKKNKDKETLDYDELIEKFEKAFLTFRYQVIYCPIEKKLRHYSDIKKSKYKFANKYLNNLDFLGSTDVDSDLVYKTTFGEIDPITHLPFDYSNLTQEEKEKVQENYLKKKRKIQNEEDKKLRKKEEEEFNLDINLDIRGDFDNEEENKENKNDNNISIFEEEEDNINKINLESNTNTNSEHFMNNIDNNNINNPLKVIKIYEPGFDIKSDNKINYILTEKNKKLKINDLNDKNEKEKENINKENKKNDENEVNQNITTKRKITVLSGIDEFDDFLNSYDKVNQQLKTNFIKNNIQNIQLNFEGNKFSIKNCNSIEPQKKVMLDIEKYKLNNN